MVVDVKVFEWLSNDCLAGNNQRIAIQAWSVRDQVLHADVSDAARQIVNALIDRAPKLQWPHVVATDAVVQGFEKLGGNRLETPHRPYDR